MEAISCALPQSPFSGESLWRKEPGFCDWKKRRAIRLASSKHDFGGRLVDEGMIVLRKRIHEMKMVERNYEPPSDWTEWEKQRYTSYDADLCRVMGVLQSVLMNTRPSVALGMLALVLFSVPTATSVVFFSLMEAISMIFS